VAVLEMDICFVSLACVRGYGYGYDHGNDIWTAWS
jgi:hypothetical protein